MKKILSFISGVSIPLLILLMFKVFFTPKVGNLDKYSVIKIKPKNEVEFTFYHIGLITKNKKAFAKVYIEDEYSHYNAPKLKLYNIVNGDVLEYYYSSFSPLFYQDQPFTLRKIDTLK